MYNLNASKISESKAINAVATAARANEDRAPKAVDGFVVEFVKMIGDEYLARVLDGGEVVATAVIDAFDI